MKNIKLFEDFINLGDEQINEAKGPSREILAIAKKIQFGTRAGIPKDVIIKGSVRNPGNEGDVDLEQWYSMLIQKFEESGFMSSFEHTKGTITSYNTVQDFILGQFFKISIQAWSSGTILLELKQKMADTKIKKIYFFGDMNSTTDIITQVLSSNREILTQLGGYEDTSGLPKSIIELQGDTKAVSAMNRVGNFDPETALKGILLNMTYYVPASRKSSIEDMIDLLNKYSKDKNYLKTTVEGNPRLL